MSKKYDRKDNIQLCIPSRVLNILIVLTKIPTRPNKIKKPKIIERNAEIENPFKIVSVVVTSIAPIVP